MTGRNAETRRFKVGDRVKFEFGNTELEGEVVEIQGTFGPDREQIVSVRAEFDLDLVRDRAMFASALTLVNSDD